MIEHDLFAGEHEQFLAAVRRFIGREIMPHRAACEEQGKVDPDLRLKCA